MKIRPPHGGWIEVYLDGGETTEELVNRFIGFPDEAANRRRQY